VAARRNSSFAPLGPPEAQAIQLEDALEVGEQDLDLLPLPPGSEIGLGFGQIAGQVASAFMDRARQVACGLVGTALRSQAAGVTVELLAR
jgi:hypothetical protein